jgi:L-histidine N-alpha-methyltransferase
MPRKRSPALPARKTKRWIRIRPVRRIPDPVAEIAAGLQAPPRAIPPKYFYDDRGSRLFDRICNTREYYLTRTEEALLVEHGADIIASSRPAQILELGSGISRKVRLLLDACVKLSHACEYAPFDVCEEMVELATDRLAADYPWLTIQPLIGDYHAGLGNLPTAHGTRLLAFLGSSIGNFTAEAGREFIREIRHALRPGDFFLLGADRVKPVPVLNAAYNDADDITAAFNLNLLNVVNRSLHADFDPGQFSHFACYNETLNQIEMYLVSRRDQEIRLGKTGTVIKLAKGERILTEISRKYSAEDLESMLAECGFSLRRHYAPDNGWYSLLLAQVR